MQSPQNGALLRAFISESDRVGGQALYKAIVAEARTAGLAGATVLHGPLSFGPSRHLNSDSSVEAAVNLPVVIEIVDTEERINEFLPRLDQMMGSGLVTVERLSMFRCGRSTVSPSRAISP